MGFQPFCSSLRRVLNKTRPSILYLLYVKFASYIGRVLCKYRLILFRINNGPIEMCICCICGLRDKGPSSKLVCKWTVDIGWFSSLCACASTNREWTGIYQARAWLRKINFDSVLRLLRLHQYISPGIQYHHVTKIK